MRIILTLFLFGVAVVGTGCSKEFTCDTDNELICDLHKKKVTHSNTIKMVFEGSESNYGPIRVEIKDPEVINKVWEMIENSKPGGRHNACGFITIEFYILRYVFYKPDAKLKVLCGGEDAGVYVEDSKRTIYDKREMRYVGLQQCPGLNEYVMKFLEEEFDKQH